jgi:RNA-directed DNA polymerase
MYGQCAHARSWPQGTCPFRAPFPGSPQACPVRRRAHSLRSRLTEKLVYIKCRVTSSHVIDRTGSRMGKFNLELHPEKTRLIEFGRFAAERRKRRAQGKPAAFDFLGFTHICSKTRNGKFTVRRKTIARRLRKKLQAVKDTLRRRMHWPIPQQGAWLKSVLLGHYRYDAVPRNGSLLTVFRDIIMRYWCQTLRRRSQRHRMTWPRMYALAEPWLPKPHILHPYPAQRLCVTTRGRSPVR